MRVIYVRCACCFDQELILFSRADLERSIPSMVDGLKPGQRKIMFCCFKRNIRKDVKVCSCSLFPCSCPGLLNLPYTCSLSIARYVLFVPLLLPLH